MKRGSAVVVLALAAFFTASQAQAQDYYSYGFPWFGYGNQGPAAYALGNIPAPPYFALHPPVYYSHPVARTYGHSPFACPSLCHRDTRRVETRIVMNPYSEVKPQEPEKKTATTVAVMPLRIANPYFQPTNVPGSELVAK